MEFYNRAFNVRENGVMIAEDTGQFMRAELQFEDSRFMLGQEMSEMNAYSPLYYRWTPVSLYVYVRNCDAVFNQAVKEGAKIVMPIEDMFRGDRCGTLDDPFGHRRMIATHVNDLSPREMEEKRKQWMEQKVRAHA